MDIKSVAEYNDKGCLIYAENYPGAFVRGRTIEEALVKFPKEIGQYLLWRDGKTEEDGAHVNIEITQRKESTLNVCDADSDVLFMSEEGVLTKDEYEKLKKLALRSAADFQSLYDSIPDKLHTVLKPKKTFYGDVPVTAEEMYIHTKNVNRYYFGEIGVDVDNEPDILRCRKKGFMILEGKSGYLDNSVFNGSYDEMWNLKKVCRRFLWHDRIHAKAMYRMACGLCGKDKISNPFKFEL